MGWIIQDPSGGFPMSWPHNISPCFFGVGRVVLVGFVNFYEGSGGIICRK
jgi:hypothetical protein